MGVVFVAIDSKQLSNITQWFIEKLNGQVVIAIMNIGDIVSLPHQRAISTYNLVTGSTPYCAKTTIE